MTREREYVVVQGAFPDGSPMIRHIVDLKQPYHPDEFQHWYYEQYMETLHDVFYYCSTNAEMLAVCERIKHGGG